MDVPLRTRLLGAFVVVVVLSGALTILTGSLLIKRMVVSEAERRHPGPNLWPFCDQYFHVAQSRLGDFFSFKFLHSILSHVAARSPLNIEFLRRL